MVEKVFPEELGLEELGSHSGAGKRKYSIPELLGKVTGSMNRRLGISWKVESGEMKSFLGNYKQLLEQITKWGIMLEEWLRKIQVERFGSDPRTAFSKMGFTE